MCEVEIFFSAEGFELPEEIADSIRKSLLVAAGLYSLEEKTSVSLTIVDKEEIRAINRDYRNIDSVTDVISFALDEGEEMEILGGTEERLLGEIVICLPKAAEQEEEYGHSLLREVCYLTVHGMLHLLGYDHMQAEDKVVMRDEEEKLMNLLGLER